MARVRPAGAGSSGTPPSTPVGLQALAVASVLEGAAAPFRAGSVRAVAYASTSSSYVLGSRAEASLVERLRRSCGVPVVASGSSAVDALRACGARRFVLVHPPWFDAEVDELGCSYFRDQGFDASLVRATGLPDDPAQVAPGDVVDWVARQLGDEADVVFLGGNGLRAAGAIDALERRTGGTVLQANQVLLWSMLAATGTPWPVTGYGRLFRELRPSAGGDPRVTREPRV